MVNEIQQHTRTPEHKAGDSGAQDTAKLAQANLQGAADSLRQQNGNATEGAALATAQKTVDQHFGNLEIVGVGTPQESAKAAPQESAKAATAGAPNSAEATSGGTNKPGDGNNKATTQSLDGFGTAGSPCSNGHYSWDIKTSDVKQSGVGDCFFMAGLASMAGSAKGQEKIKDMIKSNDDGSYTVTFPGNKNNPVNVTRQDLADNIQKGQVNNNATWANVVETAFLKYDHAAQYGTDLINSVQTQGIPIVGEVASASKATHLLTGENTSTDSMGMVNNDNRELTFGNTSKENIQNAIETSLKNGEPITATTAAKGVSNTNDSGPLQDNHAWSVTGFNAETGMVTVRNPWGTNNGTKIGAGEVGTTTDGIKRLPDGQLEMSMDTFTKRFNDINFAGKNPYVNNLENVTRDDGHNVINAAVCGKDVLTGNFSKLGGDFVKFANGEMQTVSDKWYGIVDSSERAAKTVVGQLAKMNLGYENID